MSLGKRARSQSPSSTSRRTRRARTRSPDRALAIQPPCRKTPLPADIAYIIVAHVVGDFFQDIILDPQNAPKEDVIGTMLHVSCTFRELTIKFLGLLWGYTFIDEVTMVLTNYKPSVSMLRKIAMVPYGEPGEVLMLEVPICAVVDAAVYYVDQVISKFTRRVDEVKLSIVDFEYAAYLQEVGPVLCAMYRNAISPALRPFLLGRVWHEIVKLAIVWRKAPFLAAVIYSLELCLQKAKATGGLAFTMEWPKNSSPQEKAEAEIKSIVDIEEMRPFSKLCDDELATFLDPEDALDRLPTITVQDFLSDGVLSQTLSLIQVLSDNPHFSKYCVKIVRMAKQCIGLFLSEDEEARFVGPEVVKKA